MTLSEFQRESTARFIREALDRNNWNVAAAAKELGRERKGLYLLMGKLGIRRPVRVALLISPDLYRFMGANG